MVAFGDQPTEIPADASFLAWNFDPREASAQAAAAGTGVLFLARVNVRNGLLCTNVLAFIGTAGSGLNANQNFAGLYNSAGTLIGTSTDRSAAWAGTGLQTMALAAGPFPLAPGFYWVALLSNMTAGAVPLFTRLPAPVSAASLNAGFGVTNAPFATNGTGTSLPASITPSANVLSGAPAWVALS